MKPSHAGLRQRFGFFSRVEYVAEKSRVQDSRTVAGQAAAAWLWFPALTEQWCEGGEGGFNNNIFCRQCFEPTE